MASSSWELSDFSILMPLPAKESANQLWPASAEGRGGALLPRKVYDQLPWLTTDHDRNWIYENLRVVGMRIDPCFREGSGPCQKQIRLVWQPLEKTDGEWAALDVAVHTFYSLGDADWVRVLSGLLELKARYPMEANLPLGVHPILKAQGMGGSYAKELSALLLSLCGTANLNRATAMTVGVEGSVWVFTGFDIEGGVMKRISIPRTDNQAQGFFVRLPAGEEFEASLNPVPQGENAFLSLLADSVNAEKAMGEKTVAEAVRSSLRMLNPRFSNPGTVDCASCHAARAVPAWAEAHFPAWNWKTIFGELVFEGPGNLKDTTPGTRRTNVLRAFGYFGRDPVVSARTVFETSLTLEQMN